MPSVEPAESAKETESAQAGSRTMNKMMQMASAFNEALRRFAMAPRRAHTTMNAARMAELGTPEKST